MDSQLATVLAARAAVGQPQVGAEALQEAALEVSASAGPNPASCVGPPGGCAGGCTGCHCSADVDLGL